jgi:hypothetical protein
VQLELGPGTHENDKSIGTTSLHGFPLRFCFRHFSRVIFLVKIDKEQEKYMNRKERNGKERNRKKKKGR